MRLDGKVAFVTGAAVGIGAGIAERFVEAGAAVALLDIDGEGARRHATHLQSKGTTLALQGDVAREEDVQQAIETAATQLGPPDILVNNAGIEISGNVSQLTSADWDRLLDVNLKGAFLCSKYAIPRMLGRGGVIINISSVRAFVSYEGGIAYDASKSGLIGFTRALALDHGKDGIRVNAICPGYVQTPMSDHWLASLPNPAETLKQVMAAHPLGRMGTPHDIAEAAVFLASDAAGFITGAALVVDGGMSIAGH